MTVLPTGKYVLFILILLSLSIVLFFLNSQPSDDPPAYQGACRAERDSAFYIACTADENELLKPISVLDVFQTLQVQKTIFMLNLATINLIDMLHLLLNRFKKTCYLATQFTLLIWKGYHSDYIILISDTQRISINTRITCNSVLS